MSLTLFGPTLACPQRLACPQPSLPPAAGVRILLLPDQRWDANRAHGTVWGGGGRTDGQVVAGCLQVPASCPGEHGSRLIDELRLVYAASERATTRH